MALLITLGGCAPDSSEDGPLGGVPWVLSGPEVSIGSVDDPAYAFQAVRELAVGPDGSVYSLHANDAAIRRWSASGEPMGTIGREGEGPGEFMAPRSLGFFGDTLWVWDGRQFRISYFGPSGDFLGSSSPRVDLGRGTRGATPPRPDRPLRDGSMFGSSPAWSDEIARGILEEVPYVHMNADGGVVDTVWMQQYRPLDILALLRDVGGTFLSQPFGDQPLVTFVEADETLLVVDRRTYAGSGTPAIRITKIDARSGDTVFSRTRTYEPRTLERPEADSTIHSVADELRPFLERLGFTAASLERDLAEAAYVPEYVPLVRDLAVASDGRILLQPFDQSGEVDEWWIFDAMAEPLGRLRVPPDLSIHRVVGDAVWGVTTDELDVNYIVKYSLRNPEGPEGG